MKNLKETFSKVKEISWNKAVVSFYVVKRKLLNREARYELLQVNIDGKLKNKLRNVTTKKINSSNQALGYDFNTSDLDENVLGIETAETDLQKIIDIIEADESPKFAESFEQIIGSWLYIARLEDSDNILYSVRRVSDGWTTKKVSQLINAIFRNNMLIDLDQKDIFRVDDRVDFFSFNGVIFIANKKNFETALNFREGMERCPATTIITSDDN